MDIITKSGLNSSSGVINSNSQGSQFNNLGSFLCSKIDICFPYFIRKFGLCYNYNFIPFYGSYEYQNKKINDISIIEWVCPIRGTPIVET